MHHPLAHLAWLRFKGTFRKRLQQLGTLRGAAYFLLTIAVLGLLLISREDLLAVATINNSPLGDDALHERTNVWLPVSLLLMCIYTTATAAGPPIHLSATERNFLLAAPIQKIHILLYKFALFAAGTLLSALLLGIILPPNGFSAPIFLGTFATFTFAQLFSVCVNLALTVDDSPSHPKSKMRVGLLSLFGIGICGYGTMAYLAEESVTKFVSSDPVLNILVLPFTPFAYVLTAQSAGPLIGWFLLSASISLVLLVVILRLVLTRQTALDQGNTSKQNNVSNSLVSMAPKLFALNVVAAQQMLRAIRGSGRRVGLLCASMLVLGPLLLSPSETMDTWSRMGLLFVVAAYVLPRSLVFDFRTDLGQVDHLKSLPLPAWRICAGQLLAPTLISTLCTWVLVFSALPWIPQEQWPLTLQLALYAPLANGLLFASDNLLFLLFPRAHVPTGRVDFDFMGRAMIELFAKTVLLLGVAALALYSGIWAVRQLGMSTTGLVAFTWVIAALCLGVAVFALSKAFERFEMQ